MYRILFINSCVRKGSRTILLAREYLKSIDGEITEVNLQNESIMPLNGELLEKRDDLIKEGKLDDPVFRHAREFAEADEIVIAAPFWDLGFPALLKIYIESLMVAGITFRYKDGFPVGLCRAKRLKYITTSGGPVIADFGYAYIKALAKNFFGIGEVSCRRAENLDFYGISHEDFFDKAEICEVE